MPTLSARTTLPFEQFRARLDQEFMRSVAARALKKEWVGQTVNISGAGCQGFATFQGGVVTGPIELGMPWALMGNRILGEIASVFRKAGCEDVRID